MRHHGNDYFDEYLKKYSGLATRQELTHLFMNDVDLRNSVLCGEQLSQKQLQARLKKQYSSLPNEDVTFFPRGQRSNKKVAKNVVKEWSSLMQADEETSSSSSDDTEKSIAENNLKRERKPKKCTKRHDDTLNAIMQALGIERGTVQSVPSTLKHIVTLITDIQARLMTLSESHNRVNIDTVRVSRLPGDSSQLLRNSTEAVAAKTDKLVSLKAAFEHGDVVGMIKKLQHLSSLFARDNPQFRGKQAPWTLTFTDIESHQRRVTPAQSAAAELRELTLQLFVSAIMEADRIFNKGALKRKKFSLERRDKNVVTSSEEVTIEAIAVCMKDQADWDIVQGGHVEVAVVNFERTTSSAGKLSINLNGPYFFAVVTDPSWRPISRNELDDAVYGVSALGHVTQLNNRFLFVLKYVSHMFVHIAAALSSQFDGAAYEHPNNYEYRQLAEYYEPLCEPFS